MTQRPRHGLVLTGVVLVLGLLASLPFLPGRYDPLAVPLSAAVQLAGMLGVVLLPVSAVWLAAQRLASARRAAATTARLCALLTLCLATLIALASAIVAAQDGGIVLASLLLGAAAISIARAWRASTPIGAWGPRYALVVPLAAAGCRFVLVPALAEESRARAMTNAAPLIAAIEDHHTRHGAYPLSLASVTTDFPPGVRGIERYHYERNGDAYNVFFRHMAYALDTREIVVYNPRGEHEATSHDGDLLQFAGDDLRRRRGYYASVEASQPSWKRFLFD